MDYGQLTDNTGRIADFRHVIIVMTSNCGAQEQCRNSMGFSEGKEKQGVNKAIEAAFSPEFKNRLDGIVQFNQLSIENIRQIVDKFISELEVQMNEQNIDLVVTQEVKEYLCKNGYDPKMGARPMARLINSDVKKPIADALLEGTIKVGEVATLSLHKGKVKLSSSRKNGIRSKKLASH